MSSGDFMISIDYSEDLVRVTCCGELDLSDCDRLRDACEVALSKEPRSFTLDALGITMLSSAGIRLLVHLTQRCGDEGVRLRLLLSKEIRRVLDLVGLWWLGAVEGRFATPVELRTAIHSYAEHRSNGRLSRGRRIAQTPTA